MIVTLAPSKEQTGHPHPKISVELPNDEMPLDQFLSTLLVPALLAWGYNPTTIAKHIGGD